MKEKNILHYGTCKFFTNGWGFASVDDEEYAYDVFIHQNEMVEGTPNPTEGSNLEFNIGKSDKGKFAMNIRVLEEEVLEE